MTETTLTTVKLSTAGMHCPSCSMLIELRLKKLTGVEDATSDYMKQETKVSFDQHKVDIAKILDTVEDAGYHATILTF